MQAQVRPPSDDDALTPKAVALAALAWVNEVLPWSHAKSTPGEPIPSAATAPADGVELVSEMGIDGLGASTLRLERAGPDSNAAAAARDVSFSVPAGEDADRRRASVPLQGNPIRDAIRFGRELAEHPLTWLVIVLIAIAHVAMARAGRGKK